MTGKIDTELTLCTKLHRPPVAKDHLRRCYLLDRFNQHLHRPLALAMAPAGYAKSTLASCWLEACDVPSARVAWSMPTYMDQFCQNVRSGKGRLLKCLEKNDLKVSSRCKEA